jgi:hypothetical protein
VAERKPRIFTPTCRGYRVCPRAEIGFSYGK